MSGLSANKVSALRRRALRAALILCAAALLAAMTQSATAQRVQFPTSVVGQNTVVGQNSVYGPPPQTFTTPPQTFTTPPAFTTPPQATLQGTIQPINPTWDPYADPSLGTPQLLPQQDYLNPVPGGFAGPPQRALQQIFFQYTFINRDTASDVGFDELEASVTGAFPVGISQAPILITPGFAVRFINGPSTGALPGMPDLPSEVFDAFLDAAWYPQFTPRLGADVAARIGVYSDFEFFNSDSLRIRGRGLGVFTLSPQWQLKGGVVYIDRVSLKLLPAGGVVWTPTPDTRYEILFPNPKLAQRATTIGNTDLWVYVAGEYGGGAWTIERVGGLQDEFEYNDIRVMVGAELITLGGSRAYAEVGYLFNREVDFRNGFGDFKPDDTIMVRGGIVY